MSKKNNADAWGPGSTFIGGILLTLAITLACRCPDFPSWLRVETPKAPFQPTLPLVATSAIAAIIIAIMVLRKLNKARPIHTAVTIIMYGAWSTYTATVGWNGTLVFVLCGLAAMSTIAQMFLPTDLVTVDEDGNIIDRRPKAIRTYEEIFRNCTGINVVVTNVANAKNATVVTLDIPAGSKLSDIVSKSTEIATNLRLSPGCTCLVSTGTNRGQAIVRIATKNSLADGIRLKESTTPASINDKFSIATDSDGRPVNICLRLRSMILGGAPDKGKTTLLQRIMLHLARCTDAIVWVVDLNGGGVAEPMLTTFAQGRTRNPGVDMVASGPIESIIMLAMAREIAKSRKTSKEAIRRRRGTGGGPLPVDEKLPAIVVIGDEGAEIQHVAGTLGTLINMAIDQIAEIGRNEAVRIVMSVLRGTSGALSKALRVAAEVRACLTMIEHSEFHHILDANPPVVDVPFDEDNPAVGRGYGWFITQLGAPLRWARTPWFTRSDIDNHLIATDEYRTTLDIDAQSVAARLTIADVFGGIELSKEVRAHPAVVDLMAGRAYVGRWERMAETLQTIRDASDPSELLEAPTCIADAAQRTKEAQEVIPAAQKAETSQEFVPSAVATFLDLDFGGKPQEPQETRDDAPTTPSTRVPQVAFQQPVEQPGAIARDAALVALSERKSATIAELLRDMEQAGTRVTRARVHQIMKRLVETGQAEESRDGTSVRYSLR
jgi:hypothetical protein